MTPRQNPSALFLFFEITLALLCLFIIFMEILEIASKFPPLELTWILRKRVDHMLSVLATHKKIAVIIMGVGGNCEVMYMSMTFMMVMVHGGTLLPKLTELHTLVCTAFYI